MPEPAKCRQWLEKNFPDVFAKMSVGECHLTVYPDIFNVLQVGYVSNIISTLKLQVNYVIYIQNQVLYTESYFIYFFLK